MALSNGWQAGITVGGKLATRAQAVDAMACIGAKLQDADYEPGLFLVCVPKAMAMVLLAGRGGVMSSKRIERFVKNHPEIVEDYSDESGPISPGRTADESHDGYWLYLTPGLMCYDTDTHAVHEWTVARVFESLKSVGPCEIGCECGNGKAVPK